jgi:arylsulfatase A-like enzyme
MILAFMLAFPLPAPAADEAADRPNIVFFEVDDLCYKYLGCFGNSVVKTPRIDALARNGVLFRNAICQGMMCGPSRNSLITGLYPHNLGFYQNGQMGELPEGTWTLPSALQRSGYFTAWVGKSHLHPFTPPEARAAKTRAGRGTIALRMSMGFDYSFHALGRAMLSRGREPGEDPYIDFLRDKGLYEKFLKGRGKPTPLDEDREYMDGFFVSTALSWLEKYQDQKPFFLWINTSCPHGPYDIPQKYLDPYKPEDMPPIVPRRPEGLPEELSTEDGRKRTVDKIMASRVGHAASITYIDRQVGRIVDGLRAKGVLDRTVLVFFSDQGFQMGDHGLHGKGTLFKETMNPSLIVSGPATFRRGVVETRPVELTDLLKMCLDLAGAAEDEKRKPFGHSLLPLVTGRGTYARPGPAFGEVEGFQAAVTERFKYIANAKRPVLFDLENDPDELTNVADKHPEVVRELQRAVDAWLKETGPVLPAGANRKKAP